MKKKNIIYILGDDHRQDIMGNMGHPIVKTPNMDYLAENGFLFTQAFCTSPACTPSRTCHYLGQYERKHGVNFNSNSAVMEAAFEKSFPMRLKEEGYFLGWVGKNHVPCGKGGYSSGYFETIFDYWYGNHGHSYFYPKEKHDIYRNAKHNTQVEIFEEGVMNFLDPDDDFYNSAKTKLNKWNKKDPFCLLVTFNLPHGASTGTMQLRPEDDELYKSAYRDRINDIELPKTYIPWKIDKPHLARLPKELYCGEYIPQYDYVKEPTFLRERLVRVYQTVTGVDRFIGNVIEKLKKMNILDETIIVFSTDHGIHLGEHGLGGKCFLYEEDIRIPLIIYDSDLKDYSKKINEMVVVPDIAPTILEMSIGKEEKEMQGKSLLPVMLGNEEKIHDHIFCEQLYDGQNYPKSEAVRTKRYKYVRYFKRTEDESKSNNKFRSTLDDYDLHLNEAINKSPYYEELFDLFNDPYEEYNVAKDENNSKILDELRNILIEDIKKYVHKEARPRTHLNN